MSRVRPGPGDGGGGSYTNGYSASGSTSRYASEERSGTPNSQSGGGKSRERRAGGYGGFFEGPTNGAPPAPPPQQQQQHSRPRPDDGSMLQRPYDGGRNWSDRSRSGDSERDRSRTAAGRQKGMRQIEDVLRYIQQDWGFMADDDCIPVQVALQLMDSSSLGRAHQYEQFQETHKQLQRALRAIVNEHHQGFNSSIGTFHKIQSSIQNSQGRVRGLRDSLVQAKSSLSTTNPELKGLANSSQGYDDMLQVLNQIEQLQLVPEKLEARISEKRFLTAIDILQDALRMIGRSEMEHIGALTDLRIYLSNQETSLTDILIEELHNHLYLKSPYCQDRWKSVSQDQRSVPGPEGVEIPQAGGKPIYAFLEKLQTSTPMTDDASRNPEADTFYYIQLLVESLNKMGHLDIAVNSIEQRLPVELFRVVDKTNGEVDQRHPTTVNRELGDAKRNVSRDFELHETQSKIVYDLLTTLYSKFEAIAEGHRVLHDVIQGILKREGVRNAGALTGGFKELWKLYQSEMRSLLHDYLATDGEFSHRSGQVRSSGMGSFNRNQRDRSKRVFKFSDMDNRSAELAAEQDDLDLILKSSVPGLVSNSRRSDETGMSSRNHNFDGSATGHKLLIKPSVFNMGLLLPPSLAFIQSLKGIVPPGSDIVISTLTGFLDDFLINVFHPQLDETLAELSAQTFIELDAFQEDPKWATVARKPIFRGTKSFFDLIVVFCRMLDTIPHDQTFSQLIITQMVTYYDKCFGWYKSLVTRAQSQSRQGISLKAAAAFADSGELHDISTKILTADEGERQELISKEIGLLILNTNENPLSHLDLISDRKAITSLSILHTSMEWLARKVSQLRHITTNDPESSQLDGRSRPRRRWTLLGPTKPTEEESRVYLPMNQETIVAFDGVISSYQNLALLALLTLHMELRCHAILSTTNSLRHSYVFEEPVHDPDPGILTLNTDFVAFDEDTNTYLTDQAHKFITTGLSQLLDSLLVSLATNPTIPSALQSITSPNPASSPASNNKPHVHIMNTHGADRMQLNILVLQQNLKNIEEEAPRVSLGRSARLFSLFVEGPDNILAKVKDKSSGKGGENNATRDFSYDELKALVELCYSEALASERREVAMQAKRQLNDRLLELSEHLWQS
ncbi:MAG: Pyridoxal 5'-phosphate synthase subunit snz1 [Chaenotheca gracillima]|nr:MAG: Pyridoxal 5'-phosphate synthase subunit snz1 [Chaenotheca gracillima]